MLGISYFHFFIHLILNIVIASISVIFLGHTNNFILFYLLLLIVVHSLVTDLLPHRTSGLRKIVHIILEECLPVVIILIALVLMAKDAVPWKSTIIALAIVILFSLFLKGLFCIVRQFFSVVFTQLFLGITALIFLLGIFLAPTLMVLMKNYEAKNKIYLFFAQINPLIILSNLFGEDPFHKEQLYHYFGSNFLVPKMDGVNSMVILGLFALIFWLVYAFWGEKEVVKEQ